MYGTLINTLGNSLDAPPGTSPEGFTTGDFYGNFFQVIVVLAVVIGLIVVLIRFLAARNKRWSGDRSLQVHAGVPLGQNKSMQVVEIGDAVYIVGVGDDITLLDKIDDPDRVEAFLASLEARPTPVAGTAVAALAGIVQGWRSRRRAAPEQPEWQSNEAFKDLLSQKLKGVSARKDAMKEWMEEEDR
ncbi:flagellar biosynthetic protein FliO [Paenibacillus sp.]|uniref:flagellar biosynthetic protein FliO n=1 Tax=Paenibacillus sp. TaxID=58172 RepID=UPI0028111A06|nr:flagellar biosynthetic protein FliO [Paenibacillus sp.]